MNILCVIPARYNSSRFPGKPLADILGHPMIWWTYCNAKKCGLPVLIATDSEKIGIVCKNNDMNFMITAANHTTGVDRLAEVAHNTSYDWYLLIQGDEPLLETETMINMIKRIKNNPAPNSIHTFKVPIKNPVDVVNSTIIKIVTDMDDNVLFASRSPVPYPKAGIDFTYYKSVGVYAYPHAILEQYPSLKKGYLEQAEDHDFMRALENGINIRAYTTSTDTISVDTPKDLQRIIKILEERNGVNFKK